MERGEERKRGKEKRRRRRATVRTRFSRPRVICSIHSDLRVVGGSGCVGWPRCIGEVTQGDALMPNLECSKGKEGGTSGPPLGIVWRQVALLTPSTAS